MQDARERSSQYIKGPPPQAPLLLFRGFSALVPPRGERRGQQGPRKRGTTSRARVSTRTSATEKDPLLRPYYIVYLSSEPSPILALLVFFLLLPARLLHRYLLVLRLLVSRNKQLPFSFAYKSATQLRTCPSKRTVNRSLGVIIVTYYWVIGEKKKERGSFAAETVQPKETQRSSRNCGQNFERTIVSLYSTMEEFLSTIDFRKFVNNGEFFAIQNKFFQFFGAILGF